MPLINSWMEQNMGNYSNSIVLEAGEAYPLKLEYYNGPFEGEITFLWQTPSQLNRPNFKYSDFKPVPAQYLFQPNYMPSPHILQKIAIVAKPATAITQKNLSPAPIINRVNSFKTLDADLEIKQVFFIKSRDTMTENSIERLEKLVNFLITHPHAKVDLNGYTDVVG